MNENDRQRVTKEVLNGLNAVNVRCTYGALGGILGVAPVGVGRFLGEMRPEASWVVNVKTGKPTGYKRMLMHSDLFVNERIICVADELDALRKQWK